MKRLVLAIILLLFFLFSGCITPNFEANIKDQNISGIILQNQTWSGTIRVTGDIIIIDGATLTILPGTIVKVAALSDNQHTGTNKPRDPNFPKDFDRIETQSVQFYVDGTLNAVGTETQKILFTSDSENPTTHDWDGLSIARGKLEYAIVEYARYNNIQKSSDVIIANSIIRNSLECCLCIGHTKPISPQILNNEIYNCGHEGIDYAGGSALIKGNYFYQENREIQPDPNSGGNGIVIYNDAHPVIEENVFEKNDAAIFLLSDSLHPGAEPEKKAVIRNNKIQNNATAFGITSKYSMETITIENNTLLNNKEKERWEE